MGGGANGGGGGGRGSAKGRKVVGRGLKGGKGEGTVFERMHDDAQQQLVKR